MKRVLAIVIVVVLGIGMIGITFISLLNQPQVTTTNVQTLPL